MNVDVHLQHHGLFGISSAHIYGIMMLKIKQVNSGSVVDHCPHEFFVVPLFADLHSSLIMKASLCLLEMVGSSRQGLCNDGSYRLRIVPEGI